MLVLTTCKSLTIYKKSLETFTLKINQYYNFIILCLSPPLRPRPLFFSFSKDVCLGFLVSLFWKRCIFRLSWVKLEVSWVSFLVEMQQETQKRRLNYGDNRE